MSKRMSPTAIGVFVVGGFALVIAAIVVVGSGNLFKRPDRFVCMFPGTVNGLKVGAAVKVRGVQVGTVEEIKLVLAPGEGEVRPEVKDLRLPVIVGIDPDLIKKRGGTGAALSQLGFESMISRGLSAQLEAESLLTGLLYVDLDLRPNVQPSLTLVPGSGDLREIPTIPTSMEAIQQQATEALAKLDRIDFNGLILSITKAANSINDITSSPDLKEMLASMKETMPNLNRTVTSARAALVEVSQKIGPLVASLQSSSTRANETMAETRETLDALQAVLEPGSPLSVHLNEALNEVADTSRSVGELTDYLERNPSSLLRGKYVPEKDRTSE